MNVILSRVGMTDAELRQHCVTVVQDELQQAETRVQDVVVALERVLSVVRAARELHKSFVMDATPQVGASFTKLGKSCNQIGPLLRQLHHDMSSPVMAPSESTTTGSSDSAVSTIADNKEAARLVPLSPSSSSSTSSEFHPSSDENDDDEPEVVGVAPPTGSRKRKAATVDLSTSPTPTTRVKTPVEETRSIRSQISTALKTIKETSTESYSVTAYKENASLVKQARAAEYFHGWRPRDDPTFANLLDEMEIRLRTFKDSLAQDQRRKVIRGWFAELTGASFTPTLDLASWPPKLEAELHSSRSIGFRDAKEFHEASRPASKLWDKMRVDTTSKCKRKETFFLPLLKTALTYFAALVATTKQGVIRQNELGQCNHSLRCLAELARSNQTAVTRAECMQLEELLYLIRRVMYMFPAFHKSGGKKDDIFSCRMDDILPRAGVDSAQQRAPSLGALQEEKKKTEMKLEEALAALKHVQGMARVARNLHKSLVAFVDLKPEVATSIARTTASSNQISPVQKIRSDESSSSASTSRESSAFP
ncbi:hypothetical protein BBJ28_00007843 [Nothophytophthora sp. Chile5]|nr:hypothetical protein BBJ28_00007843 [Nothophytophthora sp. Chile5]